MGSQYVKVYGEEIKVDANGSLFLSRMNIEDISDIKGLKSLANLQKLYLSGNQITEIKGLKSLANLQILRLNNNQITEIKGLKSLANLQELNLSRNQITEIKGLESLANLQYLFLRRNQISEIKGLESLANLQVLILGENQITEIKGLESLVSLQDLDLYTNQITEIKGLESLANLQKLDLNYNHQITEIKGLESLDKLQTLYLKENQIPEDLINDLGTNAKKYVDYCRKKAERLEGEKGKMSSQFVTVYGKEIKVDADGSLYLSKMNINDISDIKGLKSLANLQYLFLRRNQISEIKGLESLANLQTLYLEENQITEIKGLESLANLQELSLYSNQITEIKGLESLANLQFLGLEANKITEIKGLEYLANLQKLYLGENQITEIKGLESLVNLQELNLYWNQISEIKGLESLAKLQILRFSPNQISADLTNDLGTNAKNYVDYCRKKAEKKKAKRLETEKKVAEDTSMIRKILQLSVDNQKEVGKVEIVRSLNFSIQETNKYLELLNSSIEYESTEVPELMPKAGEIVSKFTEPTLYDLLNNLELDFYEARKIGKYLIDEGLLKEFPNFPKVKIEVDVTTFKESGTLGAFSPNDIEILRGGDWKVEGSQSLFYYKVKVKNNSQFVITNIQIILTSIPRGLIAQLDKYAINNLKPGSFESPTFKLNAQESCVGDTVEGIITYTDPIGKQQTIQINPFEICYVCNLLTPKPISKRDFDRKVDFMEEKKLVVDSHLNLTDLESKIEQIVKNCNFALLQDVKGSQDEGFVKIEAFAEGLYDKQDVALSVAIQKIGEGSKLVIKAMSDRSEKVTDLLRDFSVKLDDIKSDTELIKEYTSQIEHIFDSVGDLGAYLKDHLASDWEKIKDDYTDYKEGKITRKQLIGIGIKAIGKRFVKKIIEKVSPI